MTTHVHPPKREIFDISAGTNTDNKGIVRAVDEYVVHPWGLYMGRPTPGRVQFHYLESWLLPSVGIRANVFHFNPGYERAQDYYLDIGGSVRLPAGWCGLTTSNSAPLRTTSSTARYSECARTGCSVAKAMCSG